VHEFQSKKAPRGDDLVQLDSKIKARLWKHLIRFKEVILKAGDRLLEVESDEWLLDPDRITPEYGDKVRLLTSEDKQWTGLTGFPKAGNPVAPLYLCSTDFVV
jgi:hypothetical protein